MRHVRLAACCLLLCACKGGPQSLIKAHPMSERTLAARRLQTPLDQHICRAAVYPQAESGWSATRIATVAGRGASFQEALEALCRETDGLFAPVVADIYYWRLPSGWSPVHELRGTALRFEEGFSPPPPPRFADISAPRPQALSAEPPPAGETSPK